MKKNQFKQIVYQLGYTTLYSGHSKTFYLKSFKGAENNDELNDIAHELKRLETESGFDIVYQ